MSMDKPSRTAFEPTPEQRAAIRAIRERSRHDRPGPDELVDRGDIDEPVPHGQFLELACLVRELRRRREELGLSLTDVSERSGLTRAMVSRIENGWNLNPTLETLYRLALALGMHIGLSAERIPEEPPARGAKESGDPQRPEGSVKDPGDPQRLEGRVRSGSKLNVRRARQERGEDPGPG